jgi:hypothetical protein
MGAFGSKAPAASGMRSDALDSMMPRNSGIPAGAFGMRPSFGGAAMGAQLPSVAPPPQSGFGNKCVARLLQFCACLLRV